MPQMNSIATTNPSSFGEGIVIMTDITLACGTTNCAALLAWIVVSCGCDSKGEIKIGEFPYLLWSTLISYLLKLFMTL